MQSLHSSGRIGDSIIDGKVFYPNNEITRFLTQNYIGHEREGWNPNSFGVSSCIQWIGRNKNYYLDIEKELDTNLSWQTIPDRYVFKQKAENPYADSCHIQG